jgi:hypothetical protein
MSSSQKCTQCYEILVQTNKHECDWCGDLYCDKCLEYIPKCHRCNLSACEKCDSTVTTDGWCRECL